MNPALVVKLGGAFLSSTLLRPWLEAIGSAGSIVLVPGGGPFADAVRAAQQVMGFDDEAAHRMAILAMAQYGIALAALAPRFCPADSLAGIRQAMAAERIPVWLPWPMLRDAAEVEGTWDTTSDSLALWLACSLDAERVLLIKQRGATTPDVTVLAAVGLVDPAFPAFAARFGGPIWVAGPDDCPRGPLNPLAPPGQRLGRAGP